jgi:hypothetical protein
MTELVSKAFAKIIKLLGLSSAIKFKGVWEFTCYGPDGNVKWTEKAQNLITNVGLDHILDVIFHGTSAVATWYIGLKNAGTVAAGDTSASHAGWTENQNYTEATREAYVEAAASSQSITNSASKASFAIDTDSQTIAGAFLISESTKGGTTGVLIAAVDFASSKAADDGDTLEVTYTISAADDGA